MKLSKLVTRRNKRLGQGRGSGKGGHTSSRGQKGQGARGHVHILFEGLKTKKSMIKRLPLIRGKAKFKAYEKPVVVKLGELNFLKDGTKVDMALLVKEKFLSLTESKKFGVKIVGGGKFDKKLEILVNISKPAAETVNSLGGKASN